MSSFIALVGKRLIVPKMIESSSSISMDNPQGIKTPYGKLYVNSNAAISFYNSVVKGKVAKLINGSVNEDFFVMLLPDGDIEVRYLSRYFDADQAQTFPTDLGMKIAWSNDSSTQGLIDSILASTSDPKEIIEGWDELSNGTSEYTIVNIGTQLKAMKDLEVKDLPNPESYSGSTDIDV